MEDFEAKLDRLERILRGAEQYGDDSDAGPIDPALRFQLDEMLTELEADPETRCVVLTGTGERAFSAGNDLTGTAAGGGSAGTILPRHASAFGGLVSRFDLDKPLPDDVTTNGHQQTLEQFRKKAAGRSIRATMADYNVTEQSVELIGTPDAVADRMGEVMEQVARQVVEHVDGDGRDAARLGALAAAEVIGHIGARPETSLRALAEQTGLGV